MARRRKKRTTTHRRRKRNGITLTDDQKLQMLKMPGLDEDLAKKILKA